tara:strand:- start:2998 stop:5847 length:2850 start_codon:yes stop_codon:yes gene_type:complete
MHNSQSDLSEYSNEQTGQNMNSRKQLVCLFVFIGFILPSFAAVVSAQHASEDQNYTLPHTGTDFPVGWEDIAYGSFPPNQLRLLYPAMSDGESTEMAGNGPFPHLQFFIDSGESSDSYMDFTTRLVERGFIVAIHGESYDSTDFNEIIEQTVNVHERLEELNNSSTGPVLGSYGQFDLTHWGFGGHGFGAAGAYGAYPYWMNSTLHDSVQPPRALFGLGIDFEDWNGQHWNELAPSTWVHAPASPAASLFLTGSADEVAPTLDVETVLGQGNGLGWQIMQVLGADHYQYQDSTSFLEELNDGDATLTQEEQNSFASEHVNAYLDLMLRGSHEHFRDAFNRPLGPHVVSDSGAYLVENLLDSSFLLVNHSWITPNDNFTFGPQITVNSFVNWTLRDGRTYGDLPSGWDLDIECRVLGMNQTAGTFDANGTARCLFPMQDVAPGAHTAQMRIFVEGAASTVEFEFIRTDAPLVLTTPVPLIQVQQRGSTHVDASLFAYDPDGQEVFIQAAELVGGSVSDFTFDLDQDQRGLTVTHLVTGEEINGADIQFTLRADGDGVIDEAQTTAMIQIIPVDDPALKIADVPMQNLIEDGESILLNLTDYVQDPEGEMLFATVGGEKNGDYGPVSFTLAYGQITLTPIPNANGATVMHLLVGDGTTLPIELDIPLYVEPVNDAIIINESAWSFTVSEDESLYLNLSDLGWDLDGDNLFWTIDSSSQSVNVVRSFSQFIITPILDYSGYDDLTTINVTDGTLMVMQTLQITVAPSPDAPLLTLRELNLIDSTAGSLQWWVYDADGVIPSDTEIQVNGTIIENLSHSCVFDPFDSTNRCLSMLPLPAFQNGTVEVRVSVYDEEIGASTVAYISINMSASQPEPTPTLSEPDGFEWLSANLLATLSLVVLIVLVSIVVLLRKGAKNYSQLPDVEVEVENESEEESTDTPLGGGLLARASRKK